MGRADDWSAHPILYGSTAHEPFALRLVSLPAVVTAAEDKQDNSDDFQSRRVHPGRRRIATREQL